MLKQIQHSAFYILLTLVSGFAGQVDTQALEGPLVYLGQDDGGVDIAATELAQLLHGIFCHGIGGGGDGQGDEGLVGMEPGIPVAQMGHLQMLDGVQRNGGDEVQIAGHTADGLQSI